MRSHPIENPSLAASALTTTIGIDLSAEPRGTAIAHLEWSPHGAVLAELQVGCDDAAVLTAMQQVDAMVGIDCPFGWPVDFVRLVADHTADRLEMPAELPQGWRRDYTLRATDRWVHTQLGLVPLSVAADLIGHPAIRLAALRSRLPDPVRAPLDGSGHLAEVYPAGALKQWGLPHRGYKRAANLEARNLLVDKLRDKAPWLDLGTHEVAVRNSDDALDAVLCGLIARAVQLKATHPPYDVDLARREGWIHAPTGLLDDLV